MSGRKIYLQPKLAPRSDRKFSSDCRHTAKINFVVPQISPADYVAIGPVFATASKLDPDPVIGLDGVRAARALTDKPLVAIGGITRSNCSAVIEAGADSVAVISDLIPRSGGSVSDLVREFLAALQ